MNQYYYEDITNGLKIKMKKSFTEKDIINFAEVTKDYNPIHMDEQFAKATIFKKRIVHGQLAASTFSMMFGTNCPGIGAIYCRQNTVFKAPIYIGEDITFTIQVIDKDDDKSIITFETTAYKKDTLAIKGQATLKVQRRM